MGDKRIACANTPWNSGGMSGHGITMPDGTPAMELQPFRIREYKGRTIFQHGQLYGYRMPLEAYYTDRKATDRLEVLYGYCVWYTRNHSKFVMSKAARKRGYKSTDWFYLHKQADYAKKYKKT